MRKNKVQVFLRTRPSQKFSYDFLKIQEDKKTIHIHIPKEEKSYIVNNQISNWSFPFDGIFHNVSQEDLFNQIGTELVGSSLSGFNSTIMCYGQTGAGKTFTMTGATENFNNRGLIPRALSNLYRRIEEDQNYSISVRISYVEIYNEVIYDLLANFNPEAESNLIVVEDDKGSTWVKGLSCHLAQTEEEALNFLFEGESNRTTAAHILNKRSSRSHCVFTVYLESRSRMQSQANFSVAKLQFVDLAGSERLQKTQSTGKTLQEASYINKSLSFLEQTVIALSDKQREHIPFRQSKLTHFLKDSIGGNCKTILIANVWADLDHVEETISTMRFSMRMMKVTSEPIENIEYDPLILVRNLQKEIAALKHELAMHDALRNRGHIAYEPLSDQQKFDIREQIRKYVEGEISELDIVNVRQIEGVYEAFRNLFRSTKQEYEEQIKNLMTSSIQNQQASQQAVTSSPQGKPNKRDQREKMSTAGVSSSVTASETPQIQQPSPKVGDIDKNSGFGVGQADQNLLDENGGYLQSRKKERKRLIMNSKASNIGTKDEFVNDRLRGSNEKITEVPTRSEAFEEFKIEQGKEISNILSQNKEILSNKKKEYSVLANKINSIKSEIDESLIKLETLKREREFQGPSYTNDGELIITEEEFEEIQKLNDNKKCYREFYEDLKNLKSAILHCQKMVDLTRQRLIKEFDSWYTESYLDGEQNFENKANNDRPDRLIYEDPIEKFDTVKHSKYEGKPDEEAYNRAKESLKHRKIFGEALYQVQPVRRNPGTPILINKTNDSLPKEMEIIQPS